MIYFTKNKLSIHWTASTISIRKKWVFFIIPFCFTGSTKFTKR